LEHKADRIDRSSRKRRAVDTISRQASFAGDTLMYEAITYDQKVPDCGAIFRVARAGKSNTATRNWLDACASARPVVVTTQPD